MSGAPGLACAALEVALNRHLQLEPEAVAECAKLRGRVLAIRMPVTNWIFHLEFLDNGLRVAPETERAPDATVSGELTAVLRLIGQQLRGEEALPTGLSVQGDAGLLAQVQRVFAKVGFDPEELAARVLGDVAAVRLVRTAKGLFGWGRQAASSLSLDTAEYLREESRDLVHRADIEHWGVGVERLRDDVERLAARLDRMDRKLSEPAA